jgi:hypothetical protein
MNKGDAKKMRTQTYFDHKVHIIQITEFGSGSDARAHGTALSSGQLVFGHILLQQLLNELSDSTRGKVREEKEVRVVK